MDYTKQPLDCPQILQMLKERGLIIDDENYALGQLKIMSYFRLANYLRPMEQDKVAHIFKPNSHFDNAVNLYFFDKKLRALLFTAIQSFEIALRSKLIHHFSMAYGAFWIMDRSLYADKKIFTDCSIRVQQEVFRSKEDFIQEHFDKYSNPIIPPVWKTLEVVSFGTLSKIFCNLKDNKLKKKIAREFNLPQHEYLESWCKCAVALRNCLAHHSRIWNRRFPLKPQLPGKLKNAWIDASKTSPTKLYAQLCCLAYLQNAAHPDNDFKQQLKSLIQAYHFAHQSGTECEHAYETMLHLLAKKRVQKAFLKADSFVFDFEYRSYCPNEKGCKYERHGKCYSKIRKRPNLKDFYDCCEQEVVYDNIKRCSDLKLFSSIKPDREPVYIEFCVTHASEEEKLHSGNKIIECMIESEEDIDAIHSLVMYCINQERNAPFLTMASANT